MNFPLSIKGLKFQSEAELLNFIREQLTIHSSFHYFFYEYHWPLKKTKHHRCSSVEFNIPYKSKLFKDDEDHSKTNLPINLLSKNPEICEITETVFTKLVKQYSGTSWVKEEKRPLLHITAVKQLLFDCHACDSSFLKMLIDSLSSKTWISIENFYKSIESAYKGSAYAFISFKRYEKKSKTRFLIQKMIFFFSLIQAEVGPSITKENLFRVLYIADKRESTLVQMLVDLYFKIADDLRGHRRDFICFSEFNYAIIKSIDGY